MGQLLSVLRSHQVSEYQSGDLRIVLREEAPTRSSFIGDKAPTDDELLYGSSNYGLSESGYVNG